MRTLSCADVTGLPMTELVPAAQEELAQYQRRQPTEDCYRYELFRRAIVLRDEWAWSALYEFYHPVVSAWILAQASSVVGEELGPLVNEAFARFARAVTEEHWRAFPTSGTLLGYLKRCAYSAVTDHRRARQPWRYEEPLNALPATAEPLSADCAEEACGRLAAQEAWAMICRAAPTPTEQLVLQLVCVQGLAPRVVQQLHPTVFPCVQDVYRVKRMVLGRLQRSKELRQVREDRVQEVRT